MSQILEYLSYVFSDLVIVNSCAASISESPYLFDSVFTSNEECVIAQFLCRYNKMGIRSSSAYIEDTCVI